MIWCNNQQSKFTKTALATKKARFETTDWRALSKKANSSKKNGTENWGEQHGKGGPTGKNARYNIKYNARTHPKRKKINEIEDNIIYYVYE